MVFASIRVKTPPAQINLDFRETIRCDMFIKVPHKKLKLYK